MYRAFAGALSLALTLLVLNWILPGVLGAIVEVSLKLLDFISQLLDYLLQNMPQ